MEFFSRSEKETEQIGEQLAHKLTPGSVIAYRGGLGVGKSVFTRGIAHGLGFSGRVTSPTFTIVNEYEGGRLPIFHFDMYRLSDANALFDIGWDDYLVRDGVCIVEWSERIEEALPPETIYVKISRTDHDECRLIRMEGVAIS